MPDPFVFPLFLFILFLPHYPYLPLLPAPLSFPSSLSLEDLFRGSFAKLPDIIFFSSRYCSLISASPVIALRPPPPEARLTVNSEFSVVLKSGEAEMKANRLSVGGCVWVTVRGSGSAYAVIIVLQAAGASRSHNPSTPGLSSHTANFDFFLTFQWYFFLPDETSLAFRLWLIGGCNRHAESQMQRRCAVCIQTYEYCMHFASHLIFVFLHILYRNPFILRVADSVSITLQFSSDCNKQDEERMQESGCWRGKEGRRDGGRY